jgi:hypothetical protein
MVVDGGDAAEEGLPLAGRGGRAAKDAGAAVASSACWAGAGHRRRGGGYGNRRGHGAHRVSSLAPGS